MNKNGLFDVGGEKNLIKVKDEANVRIVVCGVGGAGGNTISRLVEELKDSSENVKYVAVNTDIQALSNCKAMHKIQIGKELLKGKGSGDDPEMGMKAADENINDVMAALSKSDMIFFVAGFGKGTGTGALPYIVEKVKSEDPDKLVVCVITTPFYFEGKRKIKLAKQRIDELKEFADAVIVISNQKLAELYGDLNIKEGFKKSDELLSGAIKGLIKIIKCEGEMNVDFNDVKTVLKNSGSAIMGIGRAKGQNRAQEALRNAIENKLISEEISLEEATKAIIFISGKDVKVSEMGMIGNELSERLHDDPSIITGFYEVDMDEDLIEVVVYIGGFLSHNPIKKEEKIRAKSKPIELRMEIDSDGNENKSEVKEDYDEPAFKRRNGGNLDDFFGKIN